MTGIILAGGKSSRMGRNKAFLEIDGQRLIDRTVGIFKDLFDEVLLVTNTPLDYIDQDVRIVTDLISGKGPIGGIYTGLFFASFERVFAASCDMPFLNRKFIKYVAGLQGDWEVAVPDACGSLQPLHAVYNRRCMKEMRRCIDGDECRMSGFCGRVRMLKIPEDDMKAFGSSRILFANVNTEEDLAHLTGNPGA